MAGRVVRTAIVGATVVLSMTAPLLTSIVGAGPAAASLVTATIDTVAGTGVRGWSGDGGPAREAKLDHPRSLALLPDGGYLFAEPYLHVVRRVWPDGTVTTVAGTGTAGYSGDGGAATSARLNFVHAAAPTPDGGFVIADTLNNRIRKVSAAGIITTIAGSGAQGFAGDGGPATSAKINNPRSVAVDADGRVAVVDSNNHRIRRVDAAGVITTIAGSGRQGFSGDGGPATAASLNIPFAVAFMGDRLLIADTNNQRIRSVSPSGVISTVAGNGAQGFSGDDGPATAASLSFPHSVDAIGVDEFLIADTRNARVRGVIADGVIRTVAGTGVIGYAGDGGAARDAQLNTPKAVEVLSATSFLTADADNSVIRLVSGTDSPPPPSSPPMNTGSPAIAGSAEFGQTMTADQGTWSGSTPMSFSFQWQRCDSPAACDDIAAAATPEYVLSLDDVGFALRVVVTASNSAGTAAAASATTARVTEPPPPPVARYAQVIEADSPSAWFRLGDPNGSTAFRTTSGAATASIIGGGIEPGVAGLVPGGDLAASFAGVNRVNGYADAPYDPALNGPVFSIELWARATGGAGTTRVPVSSWRSATPGSGSRTGDTYGYALTALNDDTWEFWLGRGVDRNFARIKSSRPVVQGGITHLVGTYDGAIASLYVDGTLAASAKVHYSALDVGLWRMGAANPGNGSNNQWQGALDEVAVYRSALTSAQVQEHYLAGVAG
jgi:hypothetical protein